MGLHLSMDETALSQGELYPILTNKSAKGKKGALIAMVKGTKSDIVLDTLLRLPRNKRLQVREVTVDLKICPLSVKEWRYFTTIALSLTTLHTEKSFKVD